MANLEIEARTLLAWRPREVEAEKVNRAVTLMASPHVHILIVHVTILYISPFTETSEGGTSYSFSRMITVFVFCLILSFNYFLASFCSVPSLNTMLI